MAFITESELREQQRATKAMRFEFPPGTRFTQAALDFINQWRLQVIVGGELLQTDATRVSHYSEGGLAYLEPKKKNS